eukprot:gene1283-424_t
MRGGPNNKGSGEIFGFVLWVCSIIAYGSYLLWAFTPQSWLHGAGITYYPDKYWAVAVPAYLLVACIYYFLAYHALYLYNCESLDSLRNFALPPGDSAPPAERLAGSTLSNPGKASVPPAAEIDIVAANVLLYPCLELF